MKTRYLDTFGKRVRILRQGRGLTQQQLTDALEKAGAPIGRSYVSEWERTEKTPTGDIVAALARVLETTTDYLLMLTDDDDPAEAASDIAISEEAEEVAQLVDEMTPERRRDALAVVRALQQQDAGGSRLLRWDIIMRRIRERDGEEGVKSAEESLGAFLDSLFRGGATGT